jgi:hypothetical protein
MEKGELRIENMSGNGEGGIGNREDVWEGSREIGNKEDVWEWRRGNWEQRRWLGMKNGELRIEKIAGNEEGEIGNREYFWEWRRETRKREYGWGSARGNWE